MKSLLKFRSELQEGVQSSADIEYTLVNKGGRGVFQKHRARRIVHGGYDTDGGSGDGQAVVASDQEKINKEFYNKLEKQPDIQVKKFQNINKNINRSFIQKKRREIPHPQQQSIAKQPNTPEKMKTESIADQHHLQDPPPVLVLKRQTIRLFNNGIKVALYHNQTLDKYFTVAVGNISANYQAEDVDSFIELLSTDNIIHMNESISEIDNETRDALIELYTELSEENRMVLQNKLLESAEEFNKLKLFALQNK